jgi:hypothetical protein
MAGTTHVPDLKAGDRCIVKVDDVNRPTGWWFGVIESVAWKDTYGTCVARITGSFRLKEHNFDPIYGNEDIVPSVNYHVYADTADTRQIAWHHTSAVDRHQEKVAGLTTRLSELRGLIKSMALSEKGLKETVEEAVRAALKAT